MGTTGTYHNPFHYTGTYLDMGTGLYQMGARYYQPEVGRFTQQDPWPSSIFDGQRYAYTDGNPVSFVDPTGYFKWPPCTVKSSLSILNLGGNDARFTYSVRSTSGGPLVHVGWTLGWYNFTRGWGDRFSGNQWPRAYSWSSGKNVVTGAGNVQAEFKGSAITLWGSTCHFLSYVPPTRIT